MSVLDPDEPYRRPDEPWCWNCERAGHTARTCPDRDDRGEEDDVDFAAAPETDSDMVLLALLDAELADAEIPEVPDYSGCDYAELLAHTQRIRERLLELHEMQVPRTDEGRDLHIQRGAARGAMDRWREAHSR